jgi:putative ABC transport system ATP-binding protein
MDENTPNETLVEDPSQDGPNKSVLVIEGLRQEFKNARRGENFAVDVDRLELPQGGFVAIQGPNGCGKTTLVTVLALLRKPSNLDQLGAFTLNVQNGENQDGSGINVKEMWNGWSNKSVINTLRRKYIGFAPQQLELLPALKVHETIASSLWLNGVPGRERRERTKTLMEQFGLTKAKVTRHRINNVSGGQQQKVTLARAIAHRPPLIFLDEPTAYLYHKDAREALEVLRNLQAESLETKGSPITVVMITHDNHLARDFATYNVTMDVRNVGERREGYIVDVE